jgi:hypothetical protein
MASNPTGQSCANCSFYIESTCRAATPNPHGGQPMWGSPDPDDWCTHWNIWLGSGTSAPAPPAPAIYYGQAIPSGSLANNGDFYVQYTFITISAGRYINYLVIWQKQNGGWHEVANNPA